jgi:hypothetical protein
MSDFTPLAYDQIIKLEVDYYLDSDAIKARGVKDLTEGSQTLALFGGAAAPIEELMYAYGVDLPNRYFFDQAAAAGADPANLDRLVNNFTFGRVTRLLAGTAAGPLVILAAPGTTIPDGTVLTTPGGLTVKTLGTLVVLASGTVTGGAAASLPGPAGNLPLNTPLTPTRALPGFLSASIGPQAWTGGADAQSNQDLLSAMIAWLDTLARGTVPAIIAGAEANGYPHCYVTEPGTGRIVAYVDDGLGGNPLKLAAAYADIFRHWRCAGANLKLKLSPELPLPIVAQLQPSPTVALSALELAMAQAWAGVLSLKRQGDGLALIELYTAAGGVTGYNGVNITTPGANLVASIATDEYQTQFGPGQVLPYQKLAYAGVIWV